MDNIQDQGTPVAPSPEGQAQAQVQVPSSDAQSGQVVADAARADGQSNAGQEGLILGKFKSPQDLEKAYTELESHNKQVEMGKAELEKLLTVPSETSVTQPQAAAPTQDENPLAPIIEPLRAEMTGVINRGLSPVIARFEVEDMHRKFGQDFLLNGKAAIEMKQKNPTLSLEEAYKLASFDRLQTTSKGAQAQATATANAQAVKAQVETSQPSGFRPVSIEDAVKDRNVSSGDIAEALGPDYAAFAETSRRKRTKNPQ